MKRFTVPCKFGKSSAPFNIYIGKLSKDEHPLFYQQAWLTERRGGVIPGEVMESFQKLAKIATDNKVSFEELCVYALGTGSESYAAQQAANKQDAPDESKAENENVTKVEEFASVEKLRDLFDDDFVLLHIQYQNQQNEIYQAILLIRNEKVQTLTSLILEGTISIESFSQYGSLEYLARGADIPQVELEKISGKYDLT